MFRNSSLCVCLFAETVNDPSEHRNNLLLREALTALFSSPLFHTQTLTREAFPVPVVCGAKHDEVVSTITKCDAPDSSGTNCRKRPRAASLGRERKRRNSQS